MRAQIVAVGFQPANLVGENGVAIEPPREEEGPVDLQPIEHLTYVRETVAELIAGEDQGQNGLVDLAPDDGAVRPGEAIALKKREADDQKVRTFRHGGVRKRTRCARGRRTITGVRPSVDRLGRRRPEGKRRGATPQPLPLASQTLLRRLMSGKPPSGSISTRTTGEPGGTEMSA